MLVWVLKPKNLNLPAFFISAAQSLIGRFHFVDAGDGVDEEQVHVVRLQPFQTLIQALGEVAALGLVNLVTRKISFRASGLRAKKRPYPSSLRPLP